MTRVSLLLDMAAADLDSALARLDRVVAARKLHLVEAAAARVTRCAARLEAVTAAEHAAELADKLAAEARW